MALTIKVSATVKKRDPEASASERSGVNLYFQIDIDMARKLTHSGEQEAPFWHKEFYRMGDEADDPRPSDNHWMHPVVYGFGNGSGGKRQSGNNPQMPSKNLNPDH
jgi:hypothetical protein